MGFFSNETNINLNTNEILKEFFVAILVVSVVEITRYLINKNKKSYARRETLRNTNI